MEVYKEQIAEAFHQGLNCAQIVLSQFSEKYSLGKEEALRLGVASVEEQDQVSSVGRYQEQLW